MQIASSSTYIRVCKKGTCTPIPWKDLGAVFLLGLCFLQVLSQASGTGQVYGLWWHIHWGDESPFLESFKFSWIKFDWITWSNFADSFVSSSNPKYKMSCLTYTFLYFCDMFDFFHFFSEMSYVGRRSRINVEKHKTAFVGFDLSACT